MTNTSEPTAVSPELLAAVVAHGESEGAADYQDRAEDVAAGTEAPEWAWPLDGADDTYIKFVGSGAICRTIGLHTSQWADVSDVWLAAFVRGYTGAHDAPAADSTPEARP